MNRAKTILSSLRVANSLRSTRLPRNHTLSPEVTTQLSLLSPSDSSLSKQLHTSTFLSTHQKLFFSSQPSSILELVSDSDWSKELEHELSNINPTLTHETAVYILKKLNKDPKKASRFFNWVCEKNGFKPSSAIYSLVLRIFANKESIIQFWATVTKMKEQGFYIDEMTYMTVLGALRNSKMASEITAWTQLYNRMGKENEMSDVMKRVVQVVTRSDWGREVERELGEMKISVSESFVLRVLEELRRNPLKALSFFKWVGGCLGYEHSSVTYNSLARVLGQGDSIGEFWGMVKEMRSLDHEMDIDTYIKISRQFQKNKMLPDAVELYEFMMDGPYKPSSQNCSMLLRAISVSGNADMNLVFRVVKKYEEAGNSLIKTDYDGIHRSLTSVGRFDEAEKMVESMKNAGYEPDNITYSQLVFGLCKARRLEEARKVLDVMEECGCVPDLKTWTILIQGHCSANEVDKALICFANMMDKNFEADADLLDVLVNGFLSQNRIDGANQLLVEMVDKARLRPWQATYKNLILKLLDKRKLEESLNLLNLMKKHNYPPFPEPFVQYISRFGTVEDAQDFLKALTVKEYPSISAYLHVFESFFREGRHYEAKDLLYKCPHHIRKHVAISNLFGSAKSSKSAAA
ncbi:pentatricopeptide repeat-containing protein At3g48250, chloroplastic-like [Actinidia eriantha]|uniref:pentatricopeptide repeat-containing protein At3g48250, chloroplastic-like n=1 Tax=Actinidia eriantha TaxID=165200 RepID=UPI00258546E6|nr:pentatricopeptide repeat-containing protein At3g48250, chloroplastic-like [Actinidia eriantha]